MAAIAVRLSWVRLPSLLTQTTRDPPLVSSPLCGSSPSATCTSFHREADLRGSTKPNADPFACPGDPSTGDSITPETELGPDAAGCSHARTLSVLLPRSLSQAEHRERRSEARDAGGERALAMLDFIPVVPEGTCPPPFLELHFHKLIKSADPDSDDVLQQGDCRLAGRRTWVPSPRSEGFIPGYPLGRAVGCHASLAQPLAVACNPGLVVARYYLYAVLLPHHGSGEMAWPGSGAGATTGSNGRQGSGDLSSPPSRRGASGSYQTSSALGSSSGPSSSKKEDKEEEEEKTHGGVIRAGIVHTCSNPQDSDVTSVVPDPYPSPQAQSRGLETVPDTAEEAGLLVCASTQESSSSAWPVAVGRAICLQVAGSVSCALIACFRMPAKEVSSPCPNRTVCGGLSPDAQHQPSCMPPYSKASDCQEWGQLGHLGMDGNTHSPWAEGAVVLLAAPAAVGGPGNFQMKEMINPMVPRVRRPGTNPVLCCLPPVGTGASSHPASLPFAGCLVFAKGCSIAVLNHMPTSPHTLSKTRRSPSELLRARGAHGTSIVETFQILKECESFWNGHRGGQARSPGVLLGIVTGKTSKVIERAPKQGRKILIQVLLRRLGKIPPPVSSAPCACFPRTERVSVCVAGTLEVIRLKSLCEQEAASTAPRPLPGLTPAPPHRARAGFLLLLTLGLEASSAVGVNNLCELPAGRGDSLSLDGAEPSQQCPGVTEKRALGPGSWKLSSLYLDVSKVSQFGQGPQDQSITLSQTHGLMQQLQHVYFRTSLGRAHLSRTQASQTLCDREAGPLFAGAADRALTVRPSRSPSGNRSSSRDDSLQGTSKKALRPTPGDQGHPVDLVTTYSCRLLKSRIQESSCELLPFMDAVSLPDHLVATRTVRIGKCRRNRPPPAGMCSGQRLQRSVSRAKTVMLIHLHEVHIFIDGSASQCVRMALEADGRSLQKTTLPAAIEEPVNQDTLAQQDVGFWLERAHAVVGLLYPCIDSRLGEPHKFKREWASVMRCVAVFVGINHASAKLDFANNVQLSLTLAALSLGLWWTFDRSRSGLGLGITVAFLATVITQLLVYNGVYQYTSPDFLYIRSWLPCIFFSGGVTVGNIGRQLAMAMFAVEASRLPPSERVLCPRGVRLSPVCPARGGQRLRLRHPTVREAAVVFRLPLGLGVREVGVRLLAVSMQIEPRKKVTAGSPLPHHRDSKSCWRGVQGVSGTAKPIQVGFERKSGSTAPPGPSPRQANDPVFFPCVVSIGITLPAETGIQPGSRSWAPWTVGTRCWHLEHSPAPPAANQPPTGTPGHRLDRGAHRAGQTPGSTRHQHPEPWREPLKGSLEPFQLAGENGGSGLEHAFCLAAAALGEGGSALLQFGGNQKPSLKTVPSGGQTSNMEPGIWTKGDPGSRAPARVLQANPCRARGEDRAAGSCRWVAMSHPQVPGDVQGPPWSLIRGTERSWEAVTLTGKLAEKAEAADRAPAPGLTPAFLCLPAVCVHCTERINRQLEERPGAVSTGPSKPPHVWVPLSMGHRVTLPGIPPLAYTTGPKHPELRVPSHACEWIHCSVIQGGDYSPSEQPEDTVPSPAEHAGSGQPFRKLRGPRRARTRGVWGKMAGPPGEGTEMPAHPESIEAVTGNDTNQMSVLRGFRGSSSYSSDVTEGSLVVDWPCGKPAGHSFQKPRCNVLKDDPNLTGSQEGQTHKESEARCMTQDLISQSGDVHASPGKTASAAYFSHLRLFTCKDDAPVPEVLHDSAANRGTLKHSRLKFINVRSAVLSGGGPTAPKGKATAAALGKVQHALGLSG
ncbi:hypothetical protein PANDA_015700 [Ailuropoda melanoleuca]|uniref:Insulin-induced gene 1 protein n=3 Tax=Laurasiatheria TaxID=314145 RepID=D2HTZ4_AILME|nr:hypothetical protein PANDA_015700 [Ailuropoda melanoleuca]